MIIFYILKRSFLVSNYSFLRPLVFISWVQNLLYFIRMFIIVFFFFSPTPCYFFLFPPLWLALSVLLFLSHT